MNKYVPALVAVIVLILTGGAIVLLRDSGDTNGSDSNAYSTATPSSSANGIPVNTPTPSPSATPTPPADAVSAAKVLLKTTKGDIALDLYPNDAPLAVTNFVTLGKRGYYDNVIFHRVIDGFMNQAGDPTGTGMGGESIYGAKFKTELPDKKFVKGTLGVARTAVMDTNGSQFFIMAEDYPSLNGQYTVMGKVADETSQAVVDAINAVDTDASDKPLQDVKITGFQILAQ